MGRPRWTPPPELNSTSDALIRGAPSRRSVARVLFVPASKHLRTRSAKSGASCSISRQEGIESLLPTAGGGVHLGRSRVPDHGSVTGAAESVDKGQAAVAHQDAKCIGQRSPRRPAAGDSELAVRGRRPHPPISGDRYGTRGTDRRSCRTRTTGRRAPPGSAGGRFGRSARTP